MIPINKQTLLVGIVLTGILLFYLITNRPGVGGGSCYIQCYDRTVQKDPADFNPEDVDAKDVCGNCLIKSIHYVTRIDWYGWEIVCECCECTGEQGGLGKCDYGNALFDMLGEMLGLCMR